MLRLSAIVFLLITLNFAQAASVLEDYLSNCGCGYSEVSVTHNLQVGQLKCDCPHFEIKNIHVACETQDSKIQNAVSCITSSTQISSAKEVDAKTLGERNKIIEEMKNEVIEN